MTPSRPPAASAVPAEVVTASAKQGWHFVGCASQTKHNQLVLGCAQATTLQKHLCRPSRAALWLSSEQHCPAARCVIPGCQVLVGREAARPNQAARQAVLAALVCITVGWCLLSPSPLQGAACKLSPPLATLLSYFRQGHTTSSSCTLQCGQLCTSSSGNRKNDAEV